MCLSAQVARYDMASGESLAANTRGEVEPYSFVVDAGHRLVPLYTFVAKQRGTSRRRVKIG